MKKAILLFSILIISFASCKKDVKPVSKEAILMQGFWQLTSYRLSVDSVVVIDGDIVESSTEILVDTVIQGGGYVTDYDYDSLRLYNNGYQFGSFKWMVDGDELIWYASYVHPDFGDSINVRDEFLIEKITTDHLNITQVYKDTIEEGNTTIFKEVMGEYYFENIESFNPL